jgi:nucleoside-diphosphate-sugar epimerase
MLRLARSPYPLPLGGLSARRSLLSLDNLVAAIDAVLAAPEPLRRPFVIADREALTVAEMVAALRRGLGRGPGLFPVPTALLRAVCQAAGREAIFTRLAGPLVVDSAALARLGWSPTVATEEGLERLARDARSGAAPSSVTRS